jgi:pimeloyl-ACP methyl ester carboxylesterase
MFFKKNIYGGKYRNLSLKKSLFIILEFHATDNKVVKTKFFMRNSMLDIINNLDHRHMKWILNSVTLMSIVIFSYTNSNATQTTMSEKGTFKSGYASVNGLNMYYEIHGTGGMPLVLIHGGGSTIETTFGHILPMLSNYTKVIAVELQAHGRTSDRNGPVTFEQDADDVTALLQYLKIEKANFFGFSNGGSTAMQIAIRHPSLVNKLVIASAFCKRDGMIPGFFGNMEKASLDNMPAPLKTAYLQVAPNKDLLQVMHDKDAARMVQFRDWKDEDLQSIKAETLFIVGDRDVVTTEHTLFMSQLVPHGRLLVIPGVHGSFVGEVCAARRGSKIPELTVTLIEEFLNNGTF